MPSLLDIIVPAIPGTNFAGNGSNDAVAFLRDSGNLDNGFNSEDILILLANNGSPTNAFDELALNHDVDRINPDGSTRSGFENVRSDLDFALGSLGGIADGSIGLVTGIGGALFGGIAAGFSVGQGLFGAATSAIGGVFGAIGSAFSSAFGGGGGGGFISDAISAVGDFFSSIFPVVLDLDGDGLELTSQAESNAFIDFDNDGIAEQTGFVGPDDGVLLFDADGDGTFSDVSEIAFVDYLEGAQTDLEGLSFFDTNGDGVLSAADAGGGAFDYNQFYIFQDLNGNGQSDEGELTLLSESGIVSIGLGLNGDSSEINGNSVHNTSEFTRADGTTGLVGDVSFTAIDLGAEIETAGEASEVITTDLGATIVTVDSAESDAIIIGSDDDEIFIFNDAEDVLVFSGGEGHDTVIFTSDHSVEDFDIFIADEVGAIRFVERETGEEFFIDDTIESLLIGDTVIETAGYFAV